MAGKGHSPITPRGHRARAERRWNALVQATGQVLWTTDAVGRVTDARGWCAFTGKAPDELHKNGWATTIHPDDCAAVKSHWQNSIATSMPFLVECRIRRYDDEFRMLFIRGMPLFDAAGAVQEWVGICTDVTDVRRVEAERDAALQREKALRESQLLATLDAAVDSIVIYQPDGTILHENSALYAVLGFERPGTFNGAFFGERARKLNAHDAQGNPTLIEDMPPMRVLRGECITAEHAIDVRLRSLHGQEIILSATGAPVRDAAGTITCGVVIFRDVTAQRQAEREREQMVHVVSHELNTPLASMKTRAQLLRRHLQRGDAPTDQDFALLEHDINRLSRMVGDLADAGRVEAPHFRLALHPCDVGALCQSVVSNQQLTTGRDLDLVCMPGTHLALADSDRIEQVLANLLGNALKYAPPTAPVRLLLSSEDGYLRVSIRDEGPGIASADQARLFERFFRVPGAEIHTGSGIGLGLGLFICQRLVEQHGGTIGVQSAPGQGATFWFTLPRLAPAS